MAEAYCYPYFSSDPVSYTHLLHVLSLELCDFLTIVLVEGYIVVADEVVALLAGSFRSFAIADVYKRQSSY